MSSYSPTSYHTLGRVFPRGRLRAPFAIKLKQRIPLALIGTIPIAVAGADSGAGSDLGVAAALNFGAPLAFGAGSISGPIAIQVNEQS